LLRGFIWLLGVRIVVAAVSGAAFITIEDFVLLAASL